MLSSARIFACTPAPSVNNLSPNSRLFASSTTCRKSYDHRLVCKAASNSSSSISDFDLYDLLGVDSSSDQADIKLAYRTLQKRCHPDIAGAAGHDMAIVLNEAYALLSDPNTRFLYDKVSSFCSYVLWWTIDYYTKHDLQTIRKEENTGNSSYDLLDLIRII